ncbi:MAG TPA: DUF1566 domain-containing protein [Ideonella sp.]|nr:DUF1566 domain-containing protein [Ideonella sp.]
MKNLLLPALAWALVAPVSVARAEGAGHKLNDTGVTLCRAADGQDSADCAGSGQDGEFGRDVQHNRPRDGRAGFAYIKIGPTGAELPAQAAEWSCVKDKVSGLVWEVKTGDGQLRDQNSTYTNYGDGRAFDASTFAAAVNAQGLCGASDWRLPTYLELHGLANYAAAPPQRTIDSNWFPYTRAGWYWSSTGVAGGTTEAWGANFNRGDLAGGGSRGGRLAVRLVRGDSVPPRLVAKGPVVLDKQAGLTWRRCSEGQAWNGAGCDGTVAAYDWHQALAHAQAEAAATGEAWRLPNAKELASIIDASRDRPAIDVSAFPDTAQTRYWSSTPLAGRPLEAWLSEFGFGNVDSRERSTAQTLRLVRDTR